MTVDKEFVTTIITIVGATVAIMSKMGKMATKEDLKSVETKLEKKLDHLTTDVHALDVRVARIEGKLLGLIGPDATPHTEKTGAAQ
jgi:hypothetical protein